MSQDNGVLPHWAHQMMAEAITEAAKRARRERLEYARFRTDPVAFGEQILGDAFTDDIKKLMQSVIENPITVARSATGVGKTHSAARVGAWFYLTFADSQVYMTAAPPLDNLKKLLWGELLSVYNRHPDIFPYDMLTTLMLSRSPRSFITGVAIPTTGTPEERQAKFCADAEDLFEMRDGSLVRYADLIGRKDVPVISVDAGFARRSELGEFFDNGTQPVYEITLEDGEIIRRTANHPLYAGWEIGPHSKTNGRFRVCQEGWMEAKDLDKGYALLGPETTDFNFGTQRMDENRLKFLAYMIGDGCFLQTSPASNGLQFTQAKNAQLIEFLHLLDEMGAPYTLSDLDKYNWVSVRMASGELVDFVRGMGLLNHRSETELIPQPIFRLAEDQIALFLNRLFSMDGHACICKVHEYEKAEIGYCSKSKQLVSDVQCLLRRFGIQSRVKSKVVRWQYHDEQRSGRYWVLSIGHAADVARFAERIGIYGKEDQVERCRQYASSRTWLYAGWRFSKPGYRWRKVVSARLIGERPTVGVYVPENHTYLSSLVEHNSGKHSGHLLFIVDEGDAVPEEVYKGIEGCMSGGMARLLIMFNPKATRGPVYDMEKSRQARVVELSALRHPNVITGEDIIPGAVTRDAIVRRINEWTRPLVEGETPSDLERFDIPDFLVGTTARSLAGDVYPPLKGGARVITEAGFYYMVLGVYPAQGANQLISQDWVDRAVSRWQAWVAEYGEKPPVEISPRLGLDVAEYGPDWNVPVLRYGSYVPRITRIWQGVDPMVTADKGALIAQQTGADVVLVDATGVGSGVAPAIARKKRGLRAVSVKVAGKPGNFVKTDLGQFYTLRDQLWWAVREWLRTDPHAMLPPEPMLLQELTVPTYSVDGNTVRVMSKETMREYLKRSPNYADALALTFVPAEKARVVRLGGVEELS